MRGEHTRARERRSRSVAWFAAALTAITCYVLLDTFVIERSYAQALGTADAQEALERAEARTQGSAAEASETSGSSGSSGSGAAGGGAGGSGSAGSAQGLAGTSDASGAATAASAAANSATSAQGAATKLWQTRYLDTSVYVVDVYTSDATALLAGFAHDTYGKNVTATTSEMAEAAGATVAINGDYYGARNDGYVVRNGVLYRETSSSADQEDLVIYADGSFEVVREGDVSAQELVDAGAWQVFSFGPGLVVDGTIVAEEGEEVGRAKASNPRTALGKVSEGHYVLVVADGRTDESAGLSLSELATFMVEELGVECAYNLDGGGSSTLWYEGEVINNPTSSGRSTKERSVSDIVYFSA